MLLLNVTKFLPRKETFFFITPRGQRLGRKKHTESEGINSMCVRERGTEKNE